MQRREADLPQQQLKRIMSIVLPFAVSFLIVFHQPISIVGNPLPSSGIVEDQMMFRFFHSPGQDLYLRGYDEIRDEKGEPNNRVGVQTRQ